MVLGLHLEACGGFIRSNHLLILLKNLLMLNIYVMNSDPHQ